MPARHAIASRMGQAIRLTPVALKVVMAPVSDAAEDRSPLAVNVVLCLERDAFDRFATVLQHLLVGLVDQAAQVRVLSSDPRVQALSLGPIQTVLHQRIVWPVAGRRIEALIHELAPRAPMLVHAMSAGSYRLAGAIADAFDTDLVLQITSLADCDAVADLSGRPVGRYLAVSAPLQRVLDEQLNIPSQRVVLVRPGVRASPRIGSFENAGRVPTVLCTTPLERGRGVGRLIEAVDLLRKRDHRFMLFLLGQGSNEASFRRMIRERELSSYVTLAHTPQRPLQAMQNADLFVEPSSEPAFSVDSLEAMGAGLAVVAAPSSICDHLRDGETCVVCEDLTPESFAASIEGLLTDPARARQLATAACEYVRLHHSVSHMAEQTAGAYRRLALARATFSIRK